MSGAGAAYFVAFLLTSIAGYKWGVTQRVFDDVIEESTK